MSFRRGVSAVGLQQSRFVAQPLHQVDNVNLAGFGQIAEILATTRQNHARSTASESGDHFAEVFARGVGRNSRTRIVTPELKNYNMCVDAERPRQSAEPTNSRTAADSLAHDAIAITFRIELSLQLRGIGLIGPYAKARRDAVSECQDYGTRIRNLWCCGCQESHKR